ncbi:uncharacterized protein LOC117180221 [Belonocnema kinseyi]|uniref:uncharacterized protein LOC117180221 n=1 Tax=Belonocnema kinseyi TaxID=2817044 RepID=UPI00143D7FDB|nr:uncharacterized protein LOC117180221 [Belonocnema kinseyi]
MSKKKSLPTWTPATPIKNPDNIISSDFTNTKIFIPSYEKTSEKSCIEQLLTNEYHRIWWKEQEHWSGKFYENKNPPKRILYRGQARNQNTQANMKNSERCATKCSKFQKLDKTKIEKKCIEGRVKPTGK